MTKKTVKESATVYPFAFKPDIIDMMMQHFLGGDITVAGLSLQQVLMLKHWYEEKTGHRADELGKR